MRRSSAPSFKLTAGVVNVESTQSRNPEAKGVAYPKVARSTARILDLLKTDDNCAQETNVKRTSERPSHEDSTEENQYVIRNEDNVKNSDTSCVNQVNGSSPGITRLFNVVWAKQSTKKHKTWEGDGVLEVFEKSIVLKDMDGKVLGQTAKKSVPLEEGTCLFVGSKEVEIIDVIVPSEREPMRATNASKRSAESAVSNAPRLKKGKISSGFLIPVKRPPGPDVLQPHVPLVMPHPPDEHQWKFNSTCLPITNVLVDPFLVRVLRPHQREGVSFLYECIMGMRKIDFFGAILADEMGLGKTLQCITLVWTLLKKGPYGGIPVLKRILVVTPSSLVSNWEKEFLSWLGKERIHLFVVNHKNKPREYKKLKMEPVLLISYEMFIRCFEDIENINFDLMICDEGHRLKNSSIKISMLLNQIRCKRKIILTGTPIQNDLQEFYALVDFVNPGVLNSLQEFRESFEIPIVACRQPNASREVRELGEKRTAELSCCTKWFILRRTQEVINQFLPAKVESVIFCAMTSLQEELYKTTISYWTNRKELSTSDNVAHLSIITDLKKICNHPSLVLDKSETTVEYLEHICGDKYSFSTDHSGKLIVLLNLLQYLSGTQERIVIVSYYTQTLDMLADVLSEKSYSFCRLDGSVPSSQRQKIVDQFNSKYFDYSVFLLSARAGGVGLNLTGASRLVLYDCDWNPATDLQAMSRIWRDGQKMGVHIYRLLTTGSIEEKMFQRQLSKTGLSGAVVDSQNKSSIKLSNEELKDLFTLQEDTSCLTHDLLRCGCKGLGETPGQPDSSIGPQECDSSKLFHTTSANPQKRHMNELFKWEHHGKPFDINILENMGLNTSSAYITYMFRNISS